MPSLYLISIITIQSGILVVLEVCMNWKRQALRVVLNEYTSPYSDSLAKQSLSHFYPNGRDQNANVITVLYVKFTIFSELSFCFLNISFT